MIQRSVCAVLLLASSVAAQHVHTASCVHDSTGTYWDQAVDPSFAQADCEYDASGIPCSTREYFMQLALEASLEQTNSSCPFAPFGVVVVNHTLGPNISHASIVCYGANDVSGRGPLWHGETAAVDNCSTILKARYGPTAATNASLWQQLSLYTTAESCPMCMAAQRWAHIGENIWGTSIETLTNVGWGQIQITSEYVQHQSDQCSFGNKKDSSYQTRLVSRVLEEEMDAYFSWQFNASYPCPLGCERPPGGGNCKDIGTM